MSTRIALLIVLSATILGGCASSLEYKRSRDGTKEEVTESSKCMGLLCSTPSRAVPVYVPSGTYGHDHYNRGGYDRDYEPPYRIRPGEACTGPFGQVHGGICYPEKPRWVQ